MDGVVQESFKENVVLLIVAAERRKYW